MCKTALHTIANDRGEDFAEDLNQRQRPVVRQATVSATFVNVMHQVNVPSAGSDLCEMYCVGELNSLLHPTIG